MKRLSLICVALLLSACGSGNSSNGVTPPAPAPIPTPAADAFYARLIGVVGDAPEDTEAGDVSAVVPNEPEDTEPPGV